jgi:hypothetical protein
VKLRLLERRVDDRTIGKSQLDFPQITTEDIRCVFALVCTSPSYQGPRAHRKLAPPLRATPHLESKRWRVATHRSLVTTASAICSNLRWPGRIMPAASPKNLIFRPLDKYSYYRTFIPIPSLLKGRCRDACSAGRDAAPAGVGVVPCAPGRPWVTVRPYYGGLP